ncbi:porin [Massilia niastensis]|uniref:porin n=1 Tax=Massilia niastensis TaxID=544911 RepID=UPI000593096C|nr:porin [Massilia niastensis]
MHPTFHFSVIACTAMCAAGAHAQTNVQIYGRLNVSVERVETSANSAGRDVSLSRLSNNRSVLGFRGTEDLGGGLKAIFQIEGTISPDTGAGAIAQRDTRVGLQGEFGTVFVGHWVTAYNGATSGLDPFYPTTAGYMSIMGNGSASSVDNVNDTASFDRRQANSVHYWTRPWNGVTLRLTHGLNEERPANGAKPSLTSLAGIYEQGPWYATLAHERHHEYQGPGRNDTGTKIGLAYKFGNTRIAGVAEKLKYETATGDLEQTAYYLSLTHQIGPHGLRAGVARTSGGKGASTSNIGYLLGGPDTGATHATLGYEYTLSKRTSVYAYYTHLDNERNAVHDFAINSLTVGPGATLKGAALGLRHGF